MSTHAPTQQTAPTRSRRGWRATRQLLAVPLAAFALLVVAAPAQAYIYWTSSGPNTIGRGNLDGTNANRSFMSGASYPYGVVVDGAHIYWANYEANTIGRANLDGTNVDQSFISGAIHPYGVAVDGTYIYWTNESTGTIGRANLAGTNANQSFITGAVSAYFVAVDGAHIYWTNFSGTIGRANLDGTGVNTDFITGANALDGVAVDRAHIYWTNNGTGTNDGTGTIGRANLDGTNVDQSFITGASGPYGVAVDGAHIYWANTQADSVGRANVDGTGPDQSFITGVNSVGVAVDALGPASVPPPVLGKSVDVAPVSGVVLVKQPGKRGFVRLRAGERIPVGSTLDTTAGVVSLTAALNARGKTTTGRFYAGQFRLVQKRARTAEQTVLTLTGPKPSRCAASGASAARKHPRKPPRKRSLWGSASGGFGTVGSDGSATELGTKWLTQDTCAGTLIRVNQGAVLVDDFPHHRSFTLRAPHSFLAHPGKGG
jgi:virginiamycin B lyase